MINMEEVNKSIKRIQKKRMNMENEQIFRGYLFGIFIIGIAILNYVRHKPGWWIVVIASAISLTIHIFFIIDGRQRKRKIIAEMV